MLQILLGGKNKDWIYSLAQGSAEGVTIAWRTYLFKITAVEYGLFSLPKKFSDRKSGFVVVITHLAMNTGKEECWTELNNLGNLVEGAWCVVGDFNQILYKTERNGSTTSTA